MCRDQRAKRLKAAEKEIGALKDAIREVAMSALRATSDGTEKLAELTSGEDLIDGASANGSSRNGAAKNGAAKNGATANGASGKAAGASENGNGNGAARADGEGKEGGK